MSKILTLLLASLAVYYWWRSQQVKEKAFQQVVTECYRADVEMLDETIALEHQGFVKDKRGAWRWLRTYAFEFTSTREHRYRGKIVMAGFHVVDFHMEPFHLN